MTADKKETFRSEVSDRLSAFFGDQDSSDTTAGNNDISDSKDSALTNLNAILLSIEWEITDEILSKLLAEIERLKPIYREDKIIFSLLQLHGSVGKYIKTKKVTAHPDSIKVLHSVYSSLEKIVQSPQMSEAAKKRLLSDQLENFKALKELILTSKTEGAPKKEIKPDKALPAAVQTKTVGHQEPGPEIVSQDLVVVLEEIKKTIKAEFESLKEELKLLVNDRNNR